MIHLAIMHRSTAGRGTRAIFLGALLALAVWPADDLAAAPADDLRRALQKIDRQLCSRFNKPGCHRSAARPKAQQKKQSATKAAPQAAQKKAAPAPSELTKKPIDNPATEVASAPQSHAKRPLPVLKPANLKPKKTPVADTQQTASVEAAPGKQDLPAPPARPAAKMAALPKPPPSPPSAGPPVVNVMPDDALSGEACIAALRTMKVDFDLPATPVVAGSCSVVEPVKLNAMGTGETRLKFPDRPLLTCGFAARLASWLSEKGEPAVRSGTGAPIQAMATGPGYQCRGRNGDSSAKLSEHAFGNAVDIGYFKLADGQVINVEDAAAASSKYYAVLAALRQAGCEYFTTVLGPGADAAHANHIHFDLERRGKKGSYKICE